MRLTRQRNYVLVLLLILPICVTQTPQVTCESYTVDGYEIRTRLVPDQTTIMLGEPIYVSFIVDNHSNQDLRVLEGGDYRNRLGRPESFTVTVQGEDNRHVPQPDAGPGHGGLLGPRRIPAMGNYTFRLFLPNWATFQEVGNYTIVASRILALSKYTSEEWDCREKTTDVQTEASTQIQVVPLDEVKMGKLIEHLGSAILNENDNESTRALKYIQDERVIPYFIKALETDSYSKKFSALHALSKFDNESAFLGLQKGFTTKAKDIEKVATEELAVQLVDNIHHTAAIALAESPHPGAIPYLLSKRHHPSESVRITILHVLGKMQPENAIPILQEMTHDKSRIVSAEAKRYLKLLSLRK